MNNRCPDCNRFVASDVHVEGVECDEFDEGSGLAYLHVEVARVCAECGTELGAATLELEVQVAPKDWEDALKNAEWETCM